MTFETVAADTPARLATSYIEGRLEASLRAINPPSAFCDALQIRR